MRNNTISNKAANRPPSKNATGGFHQRKSSKVSTNSRDRKNNHNTGSDFQGKWSKEIMLTDQNELNQEIQINSQITDPSYSIPCSNQLDAVPNQIKQTGDSIDHSEYVIDS